MASYAPQSKGGAIVSFLIIPGEQSNKKGTMQNTVQNALYHSNSHDLRKPLWSQGVGSKGRTPHIIHSGNEPGSARCFLSHYRAMVKQSAPRSFNCLKL